MRRSISLTSLPDLIFSRIPAAGENEMSTRTHSRLVCLSATIVLTFTSGAVQAQHEVSGGTTMGGGTVGGSTGRPTNKPAIKPVIKPATKPANKPTVSSTPPARNRTTPATSPVRTPTTSTPGTSDYATK